MTVFPFRPSDWVTDGHGRVAKVRAVYEGEPGEVLLDLVIYSRSGERLGRVSPHMGGPKTFEPACSSEGWHRIKEPSFPIGVRWVSSKSGKSKTLDWWFGERLPPANWKKPARRVRGSLAAAINDRYRAALERIADGHNDARGLAKEVLGRKLP